MDKRDEQPEKASSPRAESREPNSNTHAERWRKYSKQQGGIDSTDDGTHRDSTIKA
jgi:hypothetical protein